MTVSPHETSILPSPLGGGFKKYRKKPVVIEAMRMKEAFEVDTLEGLMRGKAGDYLVIGIKGEKYPVRKDVFEETYEEVKP